MLKIKKYKKTDYIKKKKGKKSRERIFEKVSYRKKYV